MPVEFGNGITVGAGSTGLPEGTPVQLQVTLRFDGSVHTNPPVGVGGTLAEGSSDYSIVEDSVPDNGEGFPQLVRFTADYTLQQYGFDPNGLNVYEDWDWDWELTSNGSDLQGADHYSEGSFDGPSSMVGDTGTLTATYWTTVGAHLAIEGRVSTVASAYGAGSAAVADFSNTFKAATTPAPRLRRPGPGLRHRWGEPVNLPPACAERSASTPAGTPVASTLACNDPEGAALTYTVVDGPSHGTLSPIVGDGSFTYTPAAGYTGADSFTFTAGDGTHTSAVATFAITVTGSGSPTSKDQCKDGGWGRFDNPTFRNQGDCVSFVAAGEKWAERAGRQRLADRGPGACERHPGPGANALMAPCPARSPLVIAATDRTTSSGLVRQLDTEMRMRRRPCQVVRPSSTPPSVAPGR